MHETASALLDPEMEAGHREKQPLDYCYIKDYINSGLSSSSFWDSKWHLSLHTHTVYRKNE